MIVALKTLLVVWLAVFLQSSVAHFIGVGGMLPDLLALAITAKALRDGAAGGAGFGALTGFLADCYHPSTMGLLTLGGTAVGFMAGAVREGIYRERITSQLVLVAGMVLARQPFSYLGQAGGNAAGYPWFLVRYGLGSALYTALLAALILPVLGRWWASRPAGRLATPRNGAN